MQLYIGYLTKDGSDLGQIKREKPAKVDFDDAFVQELMDKIEILTKEKSDISHQLVQEKSLKEESNRKVNVCVNVLQSMNLQFCFCYLIIKSYIMKV